MKKINLIKPDKPMKISWPKITLGKDLKIKFAKPRKVRPLGLGAKIPKYKF